jgi:D-alanine-D-alanine ligase
MGKKIVILHNRLSENPNVDEADVMIQVNLVREEIIDLGYTVKVMDVGEDLFKDISAVESEKPDIVFNLVEAAFNEGELHYIIPGLLKMKRIPYTGVPVEGLFITTHKVLAKKLMKLSGIPTPQWFELDDLGSLESGTRYLIKPISEDGSVGLNEKAVFYTGDPKLEKSASRLSPSRYFLEEYIHGREFSIGLLWGEHEPVVLPAGEMMFYNYGPEQPRVLGYKAKWHPETREYKNTVREFETIKDDSLKERLNEISVQCWHAFGLKGYGRVDFRVDEKNQPWVIEINGNPCISPDSGFINACQMIGISRQNIIERILNDVNF